MGKLSGLYGSNGRKYAVTQHLSQSFSLFGGDAAWRAQGTYVNGGDRSTGSYLLNNTGMREVTASAAMGWRNSRLELQGFYSFYSNQVGVLFSAQMGDEELLRERIKIGQPVNFYPWTRSIDYPHQKVVHHVGKLEGRYTFANKKPIVHKNRLAARRPPRIQSAQKLSLHGAHLGFAPQQLSDRRSVETHLR